MKQKQEEDLFESPTQDIAGFGRKVLKISAQDGNALCYISGVNREFKFFFPKALDSKFMKKVMNYFQTHGYVK
jgi:hypothetical protein